MIWLILIGLSLATAGLMWRLAGLRATPFAMLCAALVAGLAGYAWQGTPGLGGSPKPAPLETRQPDSAFANERGKMLQRFGSDAQILDAADAMHRQGIDAYGIALIRGALERNPGSPDLWVGLGNALTLYAGGLVTPAADLAFQKAAKIAPDHPGPAYFRGLAFLQQGDPDRALAIWTDLLARAPAKAPWREGVEQRVAALKQGMQ